MHAPSSEAKLQETRRRSDMSDASLTKTPQWFPMLVVCWATPAIPNAKLADSALTCEVTMQASASAKRRGWEHWNWCPKFRGNWVKGGSIFRMGILWESGSPIYSQIFPVSFFQDCSTPKGFSHLWFYPQLLGLHDISMTLACRNSMTCGTLLFSPDLFGIQGLPWSQTSSPWVQASLPARRVSKLGQTSWCFQ